MTEVEQLITEQRRTNELLEKVLNAFQSEQTAFCDAETACRLLGFGDVKKQRRLRKFINDGLLEKLPGKKLMFKKSSVYALAKLIERGAIR